jgi:hypothetical protein
VLAFTQDEANQTSGGGTEPCTLAAGTDFNSDSDDDDGVLAVATTITPTTFTNLSVAAQDLQVVGGRAVFLSTDPVSLGSPGLGLPGDPCSGGPPAGSVARYLKYYEGNGTGTGEIVDVGVAAVDFVASEQVIAARVSERLHGRVLNGDGDCDDDVMVLYDARLRRIVNAGRNALVCSLPGCPPSTPYVVKGLAVNFLSDETREGVAGVDLNVDGDTDDIVQILFNLPSAAARFVATAVDDLTGPAAVTPMASPLPGEMFGGSIGLHEIKESDLGFDLNDDSVVDDSVLLLVSGDWDEDSLPDQVDTCPDLDNPDNLDIDADGLGDTACDPDPAFCTPVPLSSCVQSDPAATSSIKLKKGATPDKDSLTWKWAGPPGLALEDFGDPVNLYPHYSLCIYDAAGTGRAILTSAIVPRQSCGNKACWRSKGDKGFTFHDGERTPRGMGAAKIKAAAGKGPVILLKGKGATLRLPTLPRTAPLEVQLVRRGVEGEVCWSAVYSALAQNASTVLFASSP